MKKYRSEILTVFINKSFLFSKSSFFLQSWAFFFLFKVIDKLFLIPDDSPMDRINDCCNLFQKTFLVKVRLEHLLDLFIGSQA